MRKGLHILILLFLAAAGKLTAQPAVAMAVPEDTRHTAVAEKNLPVFEFRAAPGQQGLNGVTKEMAGDHAFGEQIAEKRYLLDKKYTYQVEIIPGNPQMRTVVRKPVIYDAVQKIERFLKKQVKKGEMPVETATADFNKVLDVAFNILTADTERFEKAINKADDANALTNLFTQQVKLVF